MVEGHVPVDLPAGIVDEKGKHSETYQAGGRDGNPLEFGGEPVVEVGHLEVRTPAESHRNSQEGYPDEEADGYFLAESQARAEKVSVDDIDEGDERHHREEEGAQQLIEVVFFLFCHCVLRNGGNLRHADGDGAKIWLQNEIRGRTVLSFRGSGNVECLVRLFHIRDGGFILDKIATYFGPAGGPRWLVTSGFDLTLLKESALGRDNPVWLVGASAGAWRFAAWLQPEAEKSYAALMEAYITASYSRKDTPRTILQSLSSIVNGYIEDDSLLFALSNKRYRLAILTTRMKNLAASDNVLLQKVGFLSIFMANAIIPPLLHRFAERVVFYYGARPPDFCLRKEFKGRFSPLNEVNFKSAVIASGAIPIVVAGVQDIFGAPDGVYRDGGLLDYNISQDYRTKNGGLSSAVFLQLAILVLGSSMNVSKSLRSGILPLGSWGSFS